LLELEWVAGWERIHDDQFVGWMKSTNYNGTRGLLSAQLKDNSCWLIAVVEPNILAEISLPARTV
jgi:hypothetical protein